MNNNSVVYRFRLASYLRIVFEHTLQSTSVTVDWSSINKLLQVLLNASRCFQVIKSPCKR